MNRLTNKLAKIKKEKRKFLVAYLTGGVPDIEGTIEYYKSIEKGGADIIEIGVPFSDALADGLVNQEAALLAISQGIGITDIFSMVARIRKFSDTPIVFLVYYNSVFHYGTEQFILECVKQGVDGLVIPDLPLEERTEIIEYANNENICLIPLVAPNSGERISKITKGVSGFTYCVSSMGVTGMRNKFRDNVEDYITKARQCSPLPVAVGFGIADSKAAEYFYNIADGIIVGSAIVKRILTGCEPEDLGHFIRTIVNKE